MKSSLFHSIACTALLALVASPLTGCGKIKSLIARKPGLPSPSPTVSPADARVASSADPAQPPVPGTATAAATPTRPVGPSINKNAAVMVLCFHGVDAPRDKGIYAISPQEFEKDLQTIKDNGFTVIPMQDFLAWRRGDKDIPAKCCIVTIDDGYSSGYTTAWPILKKFGYPFTMFVYVNYINSGGRSVTWDQLGEMRDAGVDIQSHSYYHSDLHRPGQGVDKPTHVLIQRDIQALGIDGFLRKEVVESKQVLEKQLGIKVNCIAYPYGNHDAKIHALVKEAGYEAAFTVYGQRISYSAPFDMIGRYAVEQNNPKIFQDAIAMQGGGGGGPVLPSASMAQFAAASMITQPMQGETISNPKPLIKANIAAMGEVEPSSVEMRISGIGMVKAKYDAATKTVTYQTEQPLRDKNYSVILTALVGGKKAETRWDFNFDPTKAAPGPAKPAGKPQ